MEIKASLKYLRISPQKVRLVTKLIKGLPVVQAEAQLKFVKNRSAEPILKLLKSAISNAENNFHLTKENLFIRLIRVDEGPALKRFRPRAQGAAYSIRKRTSHINIILDEIVPHKVVTPEKKAEPLKEKTEEIKPLIVKEERLKKSFRPTEEKIAKKVLPKQKLFRRKAI